MKKNGFIATSILYSFFLVFISLFVALITAYLQNRILLSKMNEAAWDTLIGINNTKLSDLSVGDYIKFDTSKEGSALNEDATWIVAYIVESGANKTIYFMSDLSAQKTEVNFKVSYDRIAKVHPITPLIYRELVATDVYQKSFRRSGFKVYIPTSSLLTKIKNQNVDQDKLDSIFDIKDDYLVLIDQAIPNTNYQVDNFYEVKTYFFNLGSQQNNIINNYCGGYFNGNNVVYNANNPFGYINVVKDSVKNEKYVDYCSYASSVAYNHPQSDLVVEKNEVKINGDIIDSVYSSLYGYRLIAEITVNTGNEDTYIAGGKGIYMDPYLFTDGGKQT